MKRIYMDVPEEKHNLIKACAKKDGRTMKGFLEHLLNSYVQGENPEQERRVKKSGKK